MNTSAIIEVRTDLHHANDNVKRLMQVSMGYAELANRASQNVDDVIAKWGADDDMVELAKEQMYKANRELIMANNDVKAAIQEYTVLAETLDALHREPVAA